MKTVMDIGENRLIERLARLVPGRRDVMAGIGDDCAVVRGAHGGDFDLLLKSDPVIEGVHFEATAAGGLVGRKAVGRVLSDIAAMGGEPLWILIDLVAPAGMSCARIEAVYRGAAAMASRYGVAIVGGDTSRGPALELHVFAVGRVPRGKAVLRSGSKPGDRLYVTGRLGGSLLGRHLKVEPRVAEGQWLRENGWVTAMMDVSDGLAADVPRLVKASGVGVVVEAEVLPVSGAARRMGREQGEKRAECRGRIGMQGAGRAKGLDGTALEHALSDGEDFELLFTVSARKAACFEAAWRRKFQLECTAIGKVTKVVGKVELAWKGKVGPLAIRGYEHFREPR